ncbi:MAG: type II toxin-antitoxin system HicB family antitoxin [Thermodesulfobacteriota bacterium]
MRDMMSYKGYFGSVHYSDDDQVFHGKIEFIRSLINYEGTDIHSLRKAFEEAVDDYLTFCKEEKKEPEIPFKGSFNVRTGPDLHRRAMLFARSKGMNLNSIISDALEKYLSVREGAN